jgi:hypothetical protein
MKNDFAGENLKLIPCLGCFPKIGLVSLRVHVEV